MIAIKAKNVIPLATALVVGTSVAALSGESQDASLQSESHGSAEVRGKDSVVASPSQEMVIDGPESVALSAPAEGRQEGGDNDGSSGPAVGGKTVTADLEAEVAKAEKIGEDLQPEYVNLITEGVSGFNNSNPTWSRDGSLLGFEREDQKNKELVIADAKGEVRQTVSYKDEEEDDLGLDLLLPGLMEQPSYNSGISWSPNSGSFIYMSNGSEGNYDLYLGNVGKEENVRLTHHPEKDGHAHWSPVSDQVLFVSGRNGKADIFIYDVVGNETRVLTEGEKSYLYPQWSPDGKRVAMVYGSNENHDIYLIDDISHPRESLKVVVDWQYDDLRPIWSPNGEKVAFYTNYNPEGDQKQWAIAVIDVAMAAKAPIGDVQDYIVATDVVPDMDKGPAWMPDSNRIVYVKKDRVHYNPLHIVDLKTGISHMLVTNTRINHDVSCSPFGLIAFRSQVEQWDQIFVLKLADKEG